MVRTLLCIGVYSDVRDLLELVLMQGLTSRV